MRWEQRRSRWRRPFRSDPARRCVSRPPVVLREKASHTQACAAMVPARLINAGRGSLRRYRNASAVVLTMITLAVAPARSEEALRDGDPPGAAAESSRDAQDATLRGRAPRRSSGKLSATARPAVTNAAPRFDEHSCSQESTNPRPRARNARGGAAGAAPAARQAEVKPSKTEQQGVSVSIVQTPPEFRTDRFDRHVEQGRLGHSRERVVGRSRRRRDGELT